MSNAYIIDSIRTGVGKFGGGLSSVRADDMAAFVIKEIVERNPSLKEAEVDDVILGCANQAGEDNRNVARMAALLAGLPTSVPGETVNRLCSSGLSAIVAAGRAIKSQDGDLFIAGGVESMSRAPYVLSKAENAFARDAKIYDTSIGWRFVNPKMEEIYGVDGMGETAENLAERDNISREDQDKFSVWSQQKATKAKESGRLKMEMVPYPVPQRKGEPIMFADDEFIKADTSFEILSKLRPAFRKNGSVTAGNASGINDGAAALLLASENAVQKYGFVPKAKLISSAAVGVEPRIMGIGPVEAAKKALNKAGLSFNDIDIIELNEAFAAQALACIRGWGLEDYDERINPNGGAIAIGHPLGMTGARLAGSAIKELHLKDKQFALCTMCVGVGQGYAAIFERV